MKDRIDASAAAGWAVEEWRDLTADLGQSSDPDWANTYPARSHLQTTINRAIKAGPQVHYVSPRCTRLIDAAAESLNPDGFLATEDLIDNPETGRGKVWMFDVPALNTGTDDDFGIWERDHWFDLYALASFGVTFTGGDEFPGFGNGRGVMNTAIFATREQVDPNIIVRILGGGPFQRPMTFGEDVPSNLPEDTEAAKTATAWIVAANAFCRQRLVSLSASQPGRGTRKRLKAERLEYLIRPVNVVILRAMDRIDADQAESSGVYWNCRWLVNGHWRNQFHPSTGGHTPTWISPYVKGPADKPFVARERRIAVVH